MLSVLDKYKVFTFYTTIWRPSTCILVSFLLTEMIFLYFYHGYGCITFMQHYQTFNRLITRVAYNKTASFLWLILELFSVHGFKINKADIRTV